MACKDIHILRKECFKDPSEFQDNGNSKKGPGSSDFRLLSTMEPWHNPLCVNEELQRRGLSNAEEEEHGSQSHYALFDLIKTCGKAKDLCLARRIHRDVANRGLLQKDIRLSNALVSMYVKCGALSVAEQVFDELPARNAITWNALISGYAQHGLGHKALCCFVRMQDEGLTPTAVTFICVLKACGNVKAIEKGEEVHAEITRQDLLEKYQVLGTTLVDMYAKCGALAKAQSVFKELKVRDVVTWNALITGYAHYGKGDEALSCFKLMQDAGLSPNAVTFICILKACGNIGAAEKGKEIHAEVSRQGLLEKDIVLGNALVDMYAKCGDLARAQEVFEELPTWDVATWNALITGYVQHGFTDKALGCYVRMREKGFDPDVVTFICILKACGSIKAIERGEEIHYEIDKQGFLKNDIKVGNALVDMYAKCGALTKARALCDNLPARNVVTWTALISGYAEHGHGKEALTCFARMQKEGHSANSVTFVCVLKACGSIGALEKGKEVHDEIQSQRLLEKEIVLGTALVDMYAKCGVLVKAQEVFDMLAAQNVVTWNALIAGYAQHGLGDEALCLFECMVHAGLSPDGVTYISTLKACGILGAANKGKEMHDEVDRQRLLETDINVGNALVDMYVKCGILEKAQEVFDELSARTVATWTSLICGYAQVGKVKRAFSFFSKMVEESIEPSAVTFVVLLTACSHEGLVEEAELIYHMMSSRYHMIPTLEHQTCMVDVFSRAGLFDRALNVIKHVSPRDSLLLWSPFIAASRNWASIQLGRWALEYAVQVDERSAAVYICMSNVYVAASMQDDEDDCIE